MYTYCIFFVYFQFNTPMRFIGFIEIDEIILANHFHLTSINGQLFKRKKWCFQETYIQPFFLLLFWLCSLLFFRIWSSELKLRKSFLIFFPEFNSSTTSAISLGLSYYIYFLLFLIVIRVDIRSFFFMIKISLQYQSGSNYYYSSENQLYSIFPH